MPRVSDAMRIGAVSLFLPCFSLFFPVSTQSTGAPPSHPTRNPRECAAFHVIRVRHALVKARRNREHPLFKQGMPPPITGIHAVKSGRLLRAAVYLGWPRPLPERTMWESLDVLSLFEASSGDVVKAKRLRKKVASSEFADLFPVEQALREAEFLLASGEWQDARDLLVSIEEQLASVHHLREAAYLAAQLGEMRSALWFRERMTDLREHVFGDNEPIEDADDSDPVEAPHDAAEGAPALPHVRQCV